VLDLASSLEDQLPAELDVRRAHPDTFKGVEEGENPLGVFLSFEIERYNALLGVIATSLNDLKDAVEGRVAISEELEEMHSALLYNTVPRKWQKVAYPSLKPLGPWMQDLVRRVEFLRTWLEQGAPQAFWLSAFFFPQSFLTSLLQAHARSSRLPIDALMLKTQVLGVSNPAEAKQPSRGALVYGAHLQSAAWDVERGLIVNPTPGQLFAPMPLIWLHPIPVDSAAATTGTDRDHPYLYECPVYKTARRQGEVSSAGSSSNFVLYLQLPSMLPPEHWIHRGAAAILESPS